MAAAVEVALEEEEEEAETPESIMSNNLYFSTFGHEARWQHFEEFRDMNQLQLAELGNIVGPAPIAADEEMDMGEASVSVAANLAALE